MPVRGHLFSEGMSGEAGKGGLASHLILGKVQNLLGDRRFLGGA